MYDIDAPAHAVPLGDPLPAGLARYYSELDSGHPEEAAAQFSENTLYAGPGPGLETQPRIVSVGRPALLERFVRRGPQPWAHLVQLCAVNGSTCLLEGITYDQSSGSPTATYVAVATLDRDGLIARYLAFSCNGARDPIPTAVPVDTEPSPVGHVLEQYFGALDNGDFEDAAMCFSEDVLYSHPPYRHTGINGDDRVEFRGRPALLQAFRGRGRQAFGHRIISCLQRGPHGLLEGIVEDLPDGGTGSFISSLSLDAEGLIQRYVSFYCEPSVAQR